VSQILEITYEGTKLVKSTKLQMLISKFEEIKMLDERWVLHQDQQLKKLDGESREESLWCKTHQKDLRSLPERFRIKVTTIEESKDLDSMKIEELVGSLQTYE